MQPLCIQVFILFFSINCFIPSDGRAFQRFEIDKTRFTEKKTIKSSLRYLDVDSSNIVTSNGAYSPTTLPPFGSLQPLPSPSYPPVPLNPPSTVPTPTRPIHGPSPSPSPPLFVAPPPPSTGKGGPPGQFAVWCVAKPTVPDSILQRAMDYACGTHAPDCEPIQPNGPCFQPNTLLSHASFAFNSYWQRAKQAGGTCDFGGTAMLVTVDPSFGKCDFVYVL